MDADVLKQLDEIEEENDRLFGQQRQLSPKFQQITVILNENPILIGPCLEWLGHKQAEIAMATLNALYTPEQIEAMKKQMIKDGG